MRLEFSEPFYENITCVHSYAIWRVMGNSDIGEGRRALSRQQPVEGRAGEHAQAEAAIRVVVSVGEGDRDGWKLCHITRTALQYVAKTFCIIA